MKKTTMFLCVTILACVLLLGIGTDTSFAASAEPNPLIDVPVNIIEGMYDSYTDYNDFMYDNNMYEITDYLNSLNNLSLGLYASNAVYSDVSPYDNLTVYADDPIVNIIPRELFERRGSYMYIGKEYGFYVYTFADTYYQFDSYSNTYIPTYSNYNNHSIVMLFDITTKDVLTDNPVDVFSVEIEPLFQYEYMFLTDDENQCTLNDKRNYSINDNPFKMEAYKTRMNYNLVNGSNYVVPAAKKTLYNANVFEPTERYYLKDISFSVNLLNEQERNVFNNQYDPIDGLGSFIIGTRYDYLGREWQSGSLGTNTLLSEIAIFAAGFVPVLSEGIDVINYLFEVNQALDVFVNGYYYDVNNDDYTIQYLYNHKNNQLLHYGNLAGYPANSIYERHIAA